jgi:homoserine kinase type II
MTVEDIIPDVLAFFELDPAQEVVLVGPGISNRNYLVSTARGDYVVKVLRNQKPETIANDVAIQHQLHSAGIGAPCYRRNSAGDYLYRKDDQYAVISPRIRGLPPGRMSPALAFDITRHLALFHTRVQTLPVPNTWSLMDPAVVTVTSAPARELPGQNLPRGITHGDLHVGNVIVDPANPSRVLAILDFEEAGHNILLLDLALTLMSVAFPSGDDRMDPELMRAGRRGYESIRRLTDDEVAWLPHSLSYAGEAWIDWFQRQGYDRYARQHHRRYESLQAAISANWTW